MLHRNFADIDWGGKYNPEPPSEKQPEFADYVTQCVPRVLMLVQPMAEKVQSLHVSDVTIRVVHVDLTWNTEKDRVC